MSGFAARSRIEMLSAVTAFLVGRPIGLVAGLELHETYAIAYAVKWARRSLRRTWPESSLRERTGQW
ncbi:hypothetical protein ACFIOY_18065 [Bradyrhizobium sp. TZ2]